jgi:hypothetical protein
MDTGDLRGIFTLDIPVAGKRTRVRREDGNNIPVTFWGEVDRNTVSDWKCRRENDRFVCRATD